MKKLILLFWVIASIIFSGCGAIKGLMTYGTDVSLQTLSQIHTLPMRNSVGFEWEKIRDREIHGINIYRGNASGEKNSFKRIGTIGNRYATHFVDTHVKPAHTYSYKFSTFSLGKESKFSQLLYVETLSKLQAVSFLESYKVGSTVVKLLWRPHNNAGINAYIVERSVNGGEWKFISQVQGRLMVEYIDTFVRKGHSYRYRVIAQSYDKLKSEPSQPTQLTI